MLRLAIFTGGESVFNHGKKKHHCLTLYLTEVGRGELKRRCIPEFEYYNDNLCPFIQGHVRYLDS